MQDTKRPVFPRRFPILVPLASLGFVACGSSDAPQTAAPATQVAVSPADSEPAPVAEPVAPEVPAEPAKILEAGVYNYEGDDGAFEIRKRCEENGVADEKKSGECKPATVRIVFNGEELDLWPPGFSKEAPYGKWDHVEVETSRERKWLSFTGEDQIVHIDFTVKDGEFGTGEVRTWPTKSEGVLVKGSDWRGKDIRFVCDTLVSWEEEVGCQGFVLKEGEETVLNFDGYTNSYPQATVFNLGAQKFLRSSSIAQDEWTYSNVSIFSVVDGKTKEVWSGGAEGDLEWQDDGGWFYTESQCVKPAQWDYDVPDDQEPKLLKLGKEKFTKYRETWDGTKMVSKKVKSWTDRKSKCESRGRCPYVYAGSGEKLVKLGEILRDQVGVGRWHDESMVIPRELVVGGGLRVKIAEEKPDEVSFVDSVWLEVDGRKIVPVSCEEALCDRDRTTLSLSPGESVELRFENIPSEGQVRLFANGYYRYIR